MFLDNKYTKKYYSIINKALLEPRKKDNVAYYEKHHIIPRSMGGNDNKENLVLLTAKEHFICHLLLTKMCQSQNHYHRMVVALTAMSRQRGAKPAYYSKMYEYYRPKFAQAISSFQSGVKKSDDHKKKISEAIKAKPHTQMSYDVKLPDGTCEYVINRKEFCERHNLSITEFSRAANGRRLYKGFYITKKDFILP